MFLAELRTRRRKPKETLQELGQCVRGNVYEAGQDRLAMGHFMDAVTKPEIRERLFRAEPGTLDEAIEAALGTSFFLSFVWHI